MLHGDDAGGDINIGCYIYLGEAIFQRKELWALTYCLCAATTMLHLGCMDSWPKEYLIICLVYTHA